jgi:hypothetical protein
MTDRISDSSQGGYGGSVQKARAPVALRNAMERAAEREMTTQSEWMRRAIIQKLRADGIDPTQLEPAAA